jgi:cellulose synthase/poly-beta-1,6-N-acetylglucosamine synthase-like glycosyltransferase
VNSPVSVIVTVKDEAQSIQALIDSLERQSRQPDEVIIADGGSTDGTLALIQSAGPPIRAIEARGSNISQGRNAAIRAARHDIILVTDAGVSLPEDWVKRLAEPFDADPGLAMVGGFFESAPQSVFEWALGATTLPRRDEIDADSFLPSHRSVAFRRSLWDSLGGYPEWLDYCEDLLFDMQARELGHRVMFEPAATVAFRPRSSLNGFALQYYRYARGDGKALILIQRHLIRYAVYGAALLVPAIAIRFPGLGKTLTPLAGLMGAVYCQRPWRRLLATRRGRSLRDLIIAMALVPLVRFTGDVAKMIGFPAGVAWSPEADNPLDAPTTRGAF